MVIKELGFITFIQMILIPVKHCAQCPSSAPPAYVEWKYALAFTDLSPGQSYTDDLSDVTFGLGTGFVMESNDYHVPDNCACGVLSKWRFYAKAEGALQLQIWDRISNNEYALKGENYFYVPTEAVETVIEFLVPVKDRITVKNENFLGWFTSSSTSVIAYVSGKETYGDEQKMKKNIVDQAPDPTLEPTYTWSASDVNNTVNKIYAIGATAIENTTPAFTNLPSTVHIYDTDTIEIQKHLFQVKADDIDPYDVYSLFIYENSEPTLPFHFNRTSKYVYLGQDYPAVGTYTMTFFVQDQCGNLNSSVLTIKVLSKKPSFTNLPAFATITEEMKTEKVLYSVSYSDEDSTTLSTKIFTVDGSNCTNTSNICYKYTGQDSTIRNIIVNNHANFKYASNTAASDNNHPYVYITAVQLTDATNNDTNVGYFLVYVTQNNPPHFDNLNNPNKVDVFYNSTRMGDFVYLVWTTDAESDELTFTITACVPSCTLTIPFAINKDGVITSQQDFVQTYLTGFDLTISVSDPLNTNVPPQTLTVLVQNIDDIPQISNLPLKDPLLVFENMPLGTTIFTVSFNDLDTSDLHTIQATFNPTSFGNYFQVNATTGDITTAYNVINYEVVASLPSVLINIVVDDGWDSSSSTLTVIIGNVNEPPSFHQTEYVIEPTEQNFESGSDAYTGAVLWTTDQHVFDEDTGDTHYYYLNCESNSRYLLMNHTTGNVKFSTNLDYDTINTSLPFTCIVTVKDKAGLSATTVLKINIQDQNDNYPVFAQNTHYIFQVPNLSAGRFVGQVTATDADRSAKYSAIYYSLTSIPAYLTRGFLVINDFGNIYVNETWTTQYFDYGMSHTFVVLAENVPDSSGTRLSATASVVLFISGTSTSSTTTTERPVNFIEDNRNVAWITVAVTLGAILLIVIFGLILAYTVQVKRYRWCIPWCRKRLLGVKKMTKREKRRYYRDILIQEELGDVSGESDNEYLDSAFIPAREESDMGIPPPMMWEKKRAPLVHTGRKASSVPKAAKYNEPRPPLKKELTRMLQKSGAPKIWT